MRREFLVSQARLVWVCFSLSQSICHGLQYNMSSLSQEYLAMKQTACAGPGTNQSLSRLTINSLLMINQSTQ